MHLPNLNETQSKRLLELCQQTYDIDTVAIDDEKTYHMISDGDTDGIFMMETEWIKYDLRQIRPANIEELTACMALSHSVHMNPYIYPYLKRSRTKYIVFPIYKKIEAVEDILRDTHGMLLYKEQVGKIEDVIEEMPDDVKLCYKTAIATIEEEIQERKRTRTISSHDYFYKRAVFCYKLAYMKANYPDLFDKLRKHVINIKE